MKKETLEEAAGKYINDDLELYESLVDGHISYNIGVDLLNKLFKAGAKWQAERMYSEEDNIMKFLDTEVELKLSDKKTIERIKWYFETYFEQFKKK